MALPVGTVFCANHNGKNRPFFVGAIHTDGRHLIISLTDANKYDNDDVWEIGYKLATFDITKDSVIHLHGSLLRDNEWITANVTSRYGVCNPLALSRGLCNLCRGYKRLDPDVRLLVEINREEWCSNCD